MYQQYPPAQPVYYAQQQYSGCLKLLLYAVSLLWPLPIGFIIAIVFISRQDPESKSLGNTCLILSIVSIVLLCCGSLVFGIGSGFLAAMIENM